ncbi:MAG: pyrR [Verrucomicrobiaceae bacterium]|nr:pyrR [Verrucomicrobiaceae bacterium]
MPVSDPPPTLLDKSSMAACIDRLAAEICQGSQGSQGSQGARCLALVGIHRRGVPLAQRIAAAIRRSGPCAEIVTGTIDVTQYRDDLQTMKRLPKLEGSDIPFDVEDSHVVICDEVLYTGRTIRAAIDELMSFGRPRRIQLAILVDRGGRELPIQPDYTGLLHPVPAGKHIRVQFEEVDGLDTVFVQPWITPTP